MPLPELSAIHNTYLSLSRIAHERYAGSLGGKLLLRSSFDPDGVATVLAASLAGAASLCVDADADRLRQGLRAGLCDFVVSHLDEALRILKNELRRSLPVSVGLTADPEHALDAMIERGLAPDLLSAIAETQGRAFLEWGAIALSDAVRPDPSTSLVEWSVAADPARSMPRIARLASVSLDPTRGDTPARQRWLAQAPRYLGRAFGQRQCLRMTGEEFASFLALVHAEIPAAAITLDGQKP